MSERGLAIGFVAALGACVSGGAESSLALAWKIEALGGGATTCAGAGATRVELETRAVTGTGAPAAPAASSVVSCATGSILVHVPAPGDLAVAVRLRDDRDRVLAELVFPRAARAEGGTVVELGTVIFEVLTFQVGWSVERATATGAAPIDCASAGAATVALAAALVDGAGVPAATPVDAFAFPCAAGAGRTTAVLPGRYQLGFRLLGADGGDLAAVARATEVRPHVAPALAPVVFTLR